MVYSVSALTCDALPDIQHGICNSSKREFLPGDSISLNCNEGFDMDGSQTFVCTMEGKWTTADGVVDFHMPQCIDNSKFLVCSSILNIFNYY